MILIGITLIKFSIIGYLMLCIMQIKHNRQRKKIIEIFD